MNLKLNDNFLSQLPPQATIRILLADDDLDDRFFFRDALKQSTICAELITVDDGERLMTYLSKSGRKLPDVLFLDLNMPRKNGVECLKEIKLNEKLQQLPVIIYSTSVHEAVADELYKNGAHYYVRKIDLSEFRKVLQKVLTMIAKKEFPRPHRNKFILSLFFF